MLYRFVRGFNEIYGVTVLFLFIGAFFVAFACTLIYPLIPIVMLISSIFLVVIARVTFVVLRSIEERIARGALSAGRCPACRTACYAVRVGEKRVHECPGCRRVFAESGAPFVPEETPVEPATVAQFEGVVGSA